jgi:hypothetical protein
VSEKPYLLIDIDGVLNPYAQSNTQLRKAKTHTKHRIRGFDVWLRRDHGKQLLDLTDVFDLVWATTWEAAANTEIGPRLGLPELPFIPFEKLCPKQPPQPGLYWKTAVINAYAYGRPFAWIDDECSGRDMIFLAQWHTNSFLMKKIDPAIGLVDENFVELRRWAEEEMYDDVD